MKINYIQLIKENKKKIQFYKCKKFEHYANECKEEKQVEKCKTCDKIEHNFKECYKNQTCKKCKKKENTKTVYKRIIERLNNIEKYYSSSNDKEIYVTTRSEKTYKSKTKTKEELIKKKSESNKEKELKVKKKKKDDDFIDIDKEFKVKRNKGDSKFDKIKSYNIGEDLMQQKANIIIAQLLQDQKHQRILKDYMKRPIFQELRNIEESDNKIIEDYKRKEENTVAAKCNIKIKNKEIKAIIDTGAIRNIMSKALKEKLGLKIQSPNKVKFKLADRSRVLSLGKKEIKIPIRVHILESPEEDLLLRIEWFLEIGAKINFKSKLLKINNKRRKIKI